MSKKMRVTMREFTMKEGLDQVWAVIGCDILQAVGDGDESVTQTGEEVAGYVVDYAETYLPPNLVKQWRDASYEQKHVWLDEAFPKDKLYGF